MRSLLVCLLVCGCGQLDALTQVPGGDEKEPGGPTAPGVNPVCDAADAKAAFGTHALCVCDDLDLVGKGMVVRAMTNVPANVGVNGTSWVVGVHEIGGSLIAMEGIRGVGDLTTHGNFSTAGSVLGIGWVTVKADMMVGGGVNGAAVLDVSGTLGVQDETRLLGTQRFGQRGPYVAPQTPCGCGALAVDVAAKVAEAKAVGTLLTDTREVGRTETTLKSGRYYAESLANLGILKLTIDGAVTLSVAESLDSLGLQRIDLTPGSTLDVYLGGGLATLGWSVFGEGASPGTVRLFVGGERKLSLAAGLQPLNASIYAPRSVLALVGDTALGGAVFAQSIAGAGRLSLDYSPPVSIPRELCTFPE